MPDPASLAEALAYFDSYLAFKQQAERIPGVQAAVFANGSVAMSTAYGFADLENEVPLTTEHLFRVASHSKTFTAVAVMQLTETGALRLDDPVARWVDYLDGTALAGVTVRDLLANMGGIIANGRDSDYWQLYRRFPDEDTLREMLLADDAAVIPRNLRFKYSNIAYSLAGLVAEAASGMSYNELVRREIVERLGLANTGPDLDFERAAEYVVGYTRLFGDRRAPVENVEAGAMAPATGFFSTASDLVTYFSAHFFGDERLLSDESKREMQHSLWDTGAGSRYALGLQVIKVGERDLIGHGGGWPGQNTRSLADPHANLAVSVLTNDMNLAVEALAVTGVKIIDLAGSKPRPEQTLDLSRFTGRFANPFGVVDVALLGGRLFRLNLTGDDPIGQAIPLEVVDDHSLRNVGDGFQYYGELSTYTFAADGTVERVRGGSGLTTLVPFDRFVLPERVALQDLAPTWS